MPVLALPVMRSVVLAPSVAVTAAAAASFTFRAAGSVTESGNTTSRAPGAPAGIIDGDLLVAVLVHDNAISVVPSGWTLGENRTSTSIYWKIASGEGASWTWEQSVSSAMKAVVFAFQTEGATVTADGSSEAAGGASGWVLPSITLTTDNSLLVAACSNGGDRAFSSAQMTERLDTGAGTANRSLGVYSEIVAASGATGTRTITSSSVTNSAVMCAFKG